MAALQSCVRHALMDGHDLLDERNSLYRELMNRLINEACFMAFSWSRIASKTSRTAAARPSELAASSSPKGTNHHGCGLHGHARRSVSTARRSRSNSSNSVDVDFPLVLCALTPLDSIVQAAGRADREGKLTAALGRAGGKVVVFLPVDHKLPPNEYKEAAGITEAIAKQEVLNGGSVQVDSAQAIRDYFERYFGVSGMDLGEKLLDLRRGLSFASLAQEFEMISNRTWDVFVPDDEEARKAIEQLRFTGELTPRLRRILQRHMVGLSPSEFEKAQAVVERVPTVAGDEIWVAVGQASSIFLYSWFSIQLHHLAR
jgi:hypothetical protein